MNSRERYLAVYRREQPDRVPIRVWGVDPWSRERQRAGRHPSFQPLIEACLARTDLVADWGLPSGLFLSATDAVAVARHDRPSRHPGYVERVTELHTPAGVISRVDLHNPEGLPGYCVKHLIETVADAERFLSIPYVPVRGSVAGFFERDRAIGPRGIVLASLGGEPMYGIQDLIGSEQFAIWSVEERELLHRLFRTWFERQYAYLKYQLEAGVGPFFGYVGPELCIPPLQSPRDFDDFVVRYDAPLLELVHQHGGFVWCHCHGKMGPVLERFVEMGVDCLNPIEPPPMGDLTLAEAKARVAGRICLEGNVEQGDFYSVAEEEMREKVAVAIREGAPGGGLILCPSSSPWQTAELSEQALKNYLAFIDAGLALGGY